MKIAAILLGGGSGTRFSSSQLKQFMTLDDKPVAIHALESFYLNHLVSEIVIVCKKQYRYLFKDYNLLFADPGERRQDSLSSGMNVLSDDIDYVCIHDLARPFVPAQTLSLVIQEGIRTGSALVATPIKYTIKQVLDNQVIHTVDKANLWEAHTPQVLKKEWILSGLQKCKDENITVTDDVSLAEIQGFNTSVVYGHDYNIKITTPNDIGAAKEIYQSLKHAKI